MSFMNSKKNIRNTAIGILMGIMVLIGIGAFVLAGRNGDSTGESDKTDKMSSVDMMQSSENENTEQSLEHVPDSSGTTETVTDATDTTTAATDTATTGETVTEHTSAQTTAPHATEVPASTEKPTNKVEEQTTVQKNETLDEKVNHIVSELTLEEKVYQMFILAPEYLTGVNRVTQAGETTRNAINKYPVGGLIYFAENIVNENQLVTMLSNTQQYSMNRIGLKMFLCLDEEGGRVARIGNNNAFSVETFPDMAYINSETDAYRVGDVIGAYMAKYGFNVDFAPVADVITEPKNTVIGTRSFGTDAAEVSIKALAVAKGLSSHGVLATFKHFPGHGATVGDTHEGFAYTNKTEEELLQNELIPFQRAADNGVDMIMVAHISVPGILGDNTPCSLSYHMVTELLKGKMGYKGLIVTDALNMGAIAKNYSSGEAAVMAVKAGNDILLMPKNFEEASQAVINAVRSGEISEERIDESVKKIVRVKLGWQ